MAVLCVGAVSFLLRVLFALVLEATKGPARALKVHVAKFNPRRQQGELIVMNPEAVQRRFPVRTGERMVLVALLAAGLALPVRAQQTTRGPSANDESTINPTASADNAQVPREILAELDAMKKRIEQLEAQLKGREGAGDSVAAVHTTAAMTPAAPLANVSATNVSATAIAPASEAVQSEAAPPEKKPAAEPFAFADWTWLNGNPRTKEPAFDSKFFTPEIRADVEYTYDFNHPADDSIGGSSEVFRSNEVGVTQLGVGGDFHFDHVRARLLTQFGMYSETTPRNDASYSRGQWNLADAYRYVSEAYGGYHWDVWHGINVDAGIFMSYVGLFSYYNFDNWAYQPSYVSSNTPWFFTGMRIQIFPTEKLKIEPWIINGWQSYARYNGRLGLGGQVLYRPNSWISMLSNDYGVGADALGIPNRTRLHTDNSLQVKYYDHPERFLDKMAFTLTGDMGCESGGGVNCTTNKKSGGQIIAYKQSFLGYMIYNRWWFHKDRYGFTLGGGEINNPGRYLVLLPPIDGATATSGTPYFTENPGDPFKAWDMSATYDYMPSQYITLRWEFNHRHANVPYWSGPGGITPPGGNNGNPGSLVCLNGTPNCAGSPTNTWYPDLRKTEDRATMAILVKF
jgi:hypothetical protein